MDNGYPKNFFGIIKIIYAISALWLFNPNGSILVKCLKYSWSLVLYSCAISFIILQFIMFGETVKDMNKLIMQLGMLLSTVLAILKVLLLINRHEYLREMTETMQDEKYHYDTVGDFNPGQIMADAKNLTTRFTIMMFTLYGVVGIGARVSSAAIINRDVKGDYFEGNSTCYDYMPYVFYIPFPSDTKSACKMVANYMGVAICGVAFSVGCCDGFYAALLNCLKSQFIIVGGAFRTIRRRVLKRLNLRLDFEVFNDCQYPELEEELHKEMNFIIKHFNVLLRIAEDLEEMFHMIILGQVVECFVIFASCLYVATTEIYGTACIAFDLMVYQVPITSPEFGSVSLYFTAIFVELGLFCWFGDGVSRASGDMVFALYDSDWFSASRRFKTSLLITMARLQKPVHLTLGKFCPLTIGSLVSVSKGSFSYYAVFKNINNQTCNVNLISCKSG